MASGGPLKGILKNAVHGSSSEPKRSPRDLAIQHAKIIQQRKELELDILNSVEILSLYPLQEGAQFSASDPAPSDVAGFKTHVRLFQPGDYDDLIEERGANQRCGYTLCPNPKPKPLPGGKWKLINKGKPNFAIVDRQEVERWCSDLCKRRAFYVKVQLNETAAWERVGIPDIEIDLYDEGHSKQDGPTSAVASATEKPSQLGLQNDQKSAENAAALALERGDVGDASSRMMKLTIHDKIVGAPDEMDGEEDSDVDTNSHLAVEGFKPGTGQAYSQDNSMETEQ